MANEEILKCELMEIRAFHTKNGVTRSGKRRRALGNQVLMVGEAVERIEALEGGLAIVKSDHYTIHTEHHRKVTIEPEIEFTDDGSDG